MSDVKFMIVEACNKTSCKHNKNYYKDIRSCNLSMRKIKLPMLTNNIDTTCECLAYIKTDDDDSVLSDYLKIFTRSLHNKLKEEVYNLPRKSKKVIIIDISKDSLIRILNWFTDKEFHTGVSKDERILHDKLIDILKEFNGDK